MVAGSGKERGELGHSEGDMLVVVPVCELGEREVRAGFGEDEKESRAGHGCN